MDNNWLRIGVISLMVFISWLAVFSSGDEPAPEQTAAQAAPDPSLDDAVDDAKAFDKGQFGPRIGGVHLAWGFWLRFSRRFRRWRLAKERKHGKALGPQRHRTPDRNDQTVARHRPGRPHRDPDLRPPDRDPTGTPTSHGPAYVYW